ncbi:hypothetical protein ACJ73_02513 [Blastomyces percursus]|uniref:Uncharacterized protein n=1 Tax=Blastomyces percursus TaxID=1658174 RepID=A0A1J9QCE4_9EURO|nr:hypothetical protein ACJ73_02513 [Blastomyces percursus]
MKESLADSLSNVPYYTIRQSSACSARQFMTLMRILFQQNVRLSVLEVGSLTYTVFEEDLEPVQEVFASLKRLVFYISTVEDTSRPYKAQASISGSKAFYDAPFNKEANFKFFVAHYTWPRLKRLSIGNLVASKNDLIEFLRRHRLEELSIRFIGLQGSWITALPAMREAASPTLDRAIAHEWITNGTGESWYLGRHPDKLIVGGDDETSLGLQVA